METAGPLPDSGVRIVVLLLSFICYRDGRGSHSCACGPCARPLFCHWEREPLLLREAALIRKSPGRLKRLEPTQAIKTGYCAHDGQLLLPSLSKWLLIVSRALVMSLNEAPHVVCPASARLARYSKPRPVLK